MFQFDSAGRAIRLCRIGVVFLHEGAVADFGFEPLVAEGFHKKAARVAEDLGLKQFYVRNGGINDVHRFIFHLKAV